MFCTIFNFQTRSKSQNKNNKSKNKIQTKNNIKTVKYMLVFVDLKSCLRYNETI